MFFIGLVVGSVFTFIIGISIATGKLNQEYANGVKDGETMYKFNEIKAEQQINIDKMKRWETK